MKILNKNTITFLLILHLLANQSNADLINCHSQFTMQPTLINLSNESDKIASNLLENEVKKDVKNFFKLLEKEIQTNNRSYIPPKIKIEGLSDNQNSLLNDLISRNAKVIRDSKLYESNSLNDKIYKTPELITRKYKLKDTLVNDLYKDQISKADPIDMGIFNVTTVVAVGTIIGVSASNTLTDPE